MNKAEMDRFAPGLHKITDPQVRALLDPDGCDVSDRDAALEAKIIVGYERCYVLSVKGDAWLFAARQVARDLDFTSIMTLRERDNGEPIRSGMEEIAILPLIERGLCSGIWPAPLLPFGRLVLVICEQDRQ